MIIEEFLAKLWAILRDSKGAIQLRDTIRNARIDQISISTTASMQIRTTAQPADCSSAQTGATLWDINLPADWMNAAAAGAATKLGTWSGAATGTGTAAHFRIFNSQATKDNTTCIMQGSVGQGTGDLSLDNSGIVSGQTITVNTFTITDANA